MSELREHGTYAKYRVEGCRCRACSRAKTLYEKRRLRDRHRGITPFVDAGEAREHICWLSSTGVGINTVAKRSGVGVTTLRTIKSGKTTQIRPETAERVLAVHAGLAAPRALVPVDRTVSQIDDLLGLGFTKRSVAQMLGHKHLHVGRGEMVTKKNADLVDALWRRIVS
jgi:hypothetical protein